MKLFCTLLFCGGLLISALPVSAQEETSDAKVQIQALLQDTNDRLSENTELIISHPSLAASVAVQELSDQVSNHSDDRAAKMLRNPKVAQTEEATSFILAELGKGTHSSLPNIVLASSSIKPGHQEEAAALLTDLIENSQVRAVRHNSATALSQMPAGEVSLGTDQCNRLMEVYLENPALATVPMAVLNVCGFEEFVSLRGEAMARFGAEQFAREHDPNFAGGFASVIGPRIDYEDEIPVWLESAEFSSLLGAWLNSTNEDTMISSQRLAMLLVNKDEVPAEVRSAAKSMLLKAPPAGASDRLLQRRLAAVNHLSQVGQMVSEAEVEQLRKEIESRPEPDQAP